MSLLVVGTASAEKRMCEAIVPDSPLDTQVFEGSASWEVNDYGDLIVLDDSSQSGTLDVAYRIAPDDQNEAQQALEMWPTPGSTVSVVRTRVTKSDFLEIEFLESKQKVSFLANPFGCDDAEKDAPTIPVMALGSHSFPQGDPDRVRNIVEAISNRPLVAKQSATKMEQPASQGVFYCAAGGPGALSCGIGFGGIGPIATVTCDVTCPPNMYACCGPGVGRYCECKDYESGGGDGGAPPPSPGPPGGGDDDDDDEDDEDEDEDAESVSP